MRKTLRIAAASALALPLTLGAAGVAFADDVTETQTQGVVGAASGLQNAATGQANGSVAPVTQANPAANASDIAGLSDFANEGVVDGSSQEIVQDNSIDSSNEQANAAEIAQSQRTVLDQVTGLG
ncbi:hypothetical protein WIS52_12610 [Pseudonocardia nematodicida]|uniref:Secreted protein n=1 Tax=Pseudonocardia nematodicida TaxID=1206997 RepID=A0ABV1KD81_9PSEU